MNLSEVGGLLAMIREYYPAFMAGKTENEAERTARLWQEMFSGDEAANVLGALKAFVATDVKGFPPSIGQIKSKLVSQGDDGEMTEMEAWGLVKNALRNGIYGYHKEFQELPEVVRRVIGDESVIHDWAIMDIDEVDTVVSSNFMRSYRSRASHVRELQALPDNVRALYSGIADALKLPDSCKVDDGARELPKLEYGEAVEMPQSVKDQVKALQEAEQKRREEQAHKIAAQVMKRFLGSEALQSEVAKNG